MLGGGDDADAASDELKGACLADVGCLEYSLEGKPLDGDVETGTEVKISAARVSKNVHQRRIPGETRRGRLTDNPLECDDGQVDVRLNDDGGNSFKLSCGWSRCTRFQMEMRVIT